MTEVTVNVLDLSEIKIEHGCSAIDTRSSRRVSICVSYSTKAHHIDESEMLIAVRYLEIEALVFPSIRPSLFPFHIYICMCVCVCVYIILFFSLHSVMQQSVCPRFPKIK